MSTAFKNHIPLSPPQHWLFERNLIDPQNYNNAYLYRLPFCVRNEDLREALASLAHRHDAFRLCFIQKPGGWQQYRIDDERLIHTNTVDLTEPSVEEALKQISILTTYFRTQLNLTRGPLLNAVHFRCSKIDRHWILLVASHLNHDAMSWPIVIREIESLLLKNKPLPYAQRQGQQASYSKWCELLAEHAVEEAEKELPYWRTFSSRAPLTSLPYDLSERAWSNTYAASRDLKLRLDEEISHKLMAWSPRLLHAQAGLAILSSVCHALSDWSGADQGLVDLTHHGRGPTNHRSNPSKTVGFFATTIPFLYKIDQKQAPRDVVHSIAQQVGTVSKRGIGYNALRYLHPNQSIRNQMAQMAAPQIKFNFINRPTDRTQDTNLVSMTPAQVRLPQVMHPQNQRRY